MTTVVVLQPGYLPWLGFFDQMLRSDIFVYYDDVQYDKHGWRNRNRLKSPAGPAWLTVPILHSGRMGQLINEVEIDGKVPWARTHLRTIRQLYARAPHRDRYLAELEETLCGNWIRLVDVDIALIELLCRWIGISRPTYRSSELAISGGRNERLLTICRHFGADRYLSGNSAKDYLDVAMFGRNRVTVEWQNYAHPTYPQLHGPFAPYLSSLDLVLNSGPESLAILSNAVRR